MAVDVYVIYFRVVCMGVYIGDAYVDGGGEAKGNTPDPTAVLLVVL